MASFVLRRLLEAVPVVLVVSVVVFLLLRLVPGDPAVVLAGPDATPDQLAAVRRDLGLDLPVPLQFAAWAMRVLGGDLGISLVTGRPVGELVGRALPATAQLALAATLVALALGVPLGVLAALRVRTRWDALVGAVSAVALGVPNFLLGIGALLLFALALGWLPPGGRVDPAEDLRAGLASLVLPALTLGLASAATLARFVRAELLDVLRLDYVRTARGKGLREPDVVTRHALRNALLPLTSVIGVQLARLVGGAIVVEQVFAWPGMGRLALQAALTRDYALFQGIVLVLVAGALFMSLLADLGYGVLDPRIRSGR